MYVTVLSSRTFNT